ncbi:MAG: pseudouridine synthase [Steroidobacteraceae bacterium]
MTGKPLPGVSKVPRHGVARVISKLGWGSRTQAVQWVREGRIRVNGRIVRNAEFPVQRGLDCIAIDDQEASQAARTVLMLHKPRGLVTSTSDERGRDTVYACLAEPALPWLAPIGRLDKASEGLLLFSNDPVWASRITHPDTGPPKTYHVQIDRLPRASLLSELGQGVVLEGRRLAVSSVRILRTGKKNAWLEIVLHEGRNRHIRRLLAAFDVSVVRLVRVAIGSLALGELAKGRWRILTQNEIDSLWSTAALKTPPGTLRHRAGCFDR